MYYKPQELNKDKMFIVAYTFWFLLLLGIDNNV